LINHLVRSTAKQWWDERKDHVKTAAKGAVVAARKPAEGGDVSEPPKTTKKPLPVWLAKYSLVLPIIAFAIASVSELFVGGADGDAQAQWVVAIVVLVLSSMGLIAGTVALAGLRKHPFFRIAPFAVIGFPASFYLVVTTLRMMFG
jgi:hypothetical protein